MSDIERRRMFFTDHQELRRRLGLPPSESGAPVDLSEIEEAWKIQATPEELDEWVRIKASDAIIESVFRGIGPDIVVDQTDLGASDDRPLGPDHPLYQAH